MPSLAFSTLGCPGVAIDRVAEVAARDGYAGVELRVAPGEPIDVAIDAAARRAVVRSLAAHGIQALTVASYARVADITVDDADVIETAVAAGYLAADLGAHYLRVFPGGPVTSEETAAATVDDTAVRRLRAIAAALAGTGVTVAIETHDSHPRGADVRRLTDRCPSVTVIWDVLHSWRHGESPTATLAKLGDRLAYVQIKDVRSRETLLPCAPGDGILPLDEVIRALAAVGYPDWISWEYEHTWFPQTPALEDIADTVSAWLHAHL